MSNTMVAIIAVVAFVLGVICGVIFFADDADAAPVGASAATTETVAGRGWDRKGLDAVRVG